MQFAVRTHVGQREGENEDSVGADEKNGLWLVADGMGGHASGGVASRIVRDKLVELAAGESLDAAVLDAHAAIRAAAEQNEQLRGMGSTVVAAKVTEKACRIVWVGDSRAYLWRDGALSRLTRDHSWLELGRAFEESGSELPGDPPPSHGIYQTLGLGEPQPSSVDLRLHDGDRILLASDGLSGELEDGEIADILGSVAGASSAADTLIATALEKGGRDNVSTVVIDLESVDEPVKSRVWPAVVGGMLLALLAAGLLWRVWMSR